MQLCFPGRVRFVDSVTQVPAGARLVVWGVRDSLEGLAPNVQVVHVEDGFLRSVGLGADLVRPLSWVVDDCGMYFDATRPSRLEFILQSTVFDGVVIDRARDLRTKIVAARLSKYNIAGGAWRRPSAGVRCVLVIGQVETDASLFFGAVSVRRNMDLLRAVRAQCKDDYIIYKPHPDVVAGMRNAGIDEHSARTWCDEVVVDVSISEMLDAVDEVHVMTSLTGFEALLRGKRVQCHGLPFYAGWGLTHDVARCPRRTRRLTIDELVAGSLLVYPLYFDRSGERCISAEDALGVLQAWKATAGDVVPWWRWLFRIILRLVVGVR